MTPEMRAAAVFQGDRWLHGYARGKTRWDPAYARVAAVLSGSRHPLLDIGCGVGLLAAYLRESGCEQDIVGVEPDSKKVAMARACVATRYAGLNFTVGDACRLPAFSGDVVMLDVLHYMTAQQQQEALQNILRVLAPGGRALIRTTFRDGSWRYYATLVEEAVVRLSGWIRGGECRFPQAQEVRTPFVERGWQVKVSALWGHTPFNSHLVEVLRPE